MSERSDPQRADVIQRLQMRDSADHLYASGLLYQAISYPTKRHRDFADAIQSVNGGNGGAFKRSHLSMARICQHTGGKAGAEAFVRREIEVIERFTERTGYQPFKITRGGGISHEVTTYEDFLSPAANWLVQVARDDKEAWSKHPGAAMQKYLPEGVRLIPRVPTEEEQVREAMAIDDVLYIQRMSKQSINCALKACERVDRNGGDMVAFAESVAERLLRYVKDQRRSRATAEKTEAVGVTDLLPLQVENLQNAEQKPDMCAHALTYARAGKPVFPVQADKSPYTARGFKDATCDEGTIRAWWRKWPNASIGVPTGEVSGWLVSDIDPPHGGDASLTALIEKYGDVPVTREARTGGGGHHIIFVYPKGLTIRNSAGKLGEGIDVRGEGGYIIVAPSMHASGRRYQWLNDDEPAPLPEWLLTLLTEAEWAITYIRLTNSLTGQKRRNKGQFNP